VQLHASIQASASQMRRRLHACHSARRSLRSSCLWLERPPGCACCARASLNFDVNKILRNTRRAAHPSISVVWMDVINFSRALGQGGGGYEGQG